MKIPERPEDKKWCDLYLQTGNAAASAQAAYGTEEGHNANIQGYRKRVLFADYLAQETKTNYSGLVPHAQDIILNLARHAKQEAVRLKAAQDILDRAGMTPVQKQEITIEQRTDEEIDRQLNAIMQGKRVELH